MTPPNTLTDTSLASLIARVEGATEGSQALDAGISAALGYMPMLSDDRPSFAEGWTPYFRVHDDGLRVSLRVNNTDEGDHPYATRVPAALTSSLDAALALVERVLGRGWYCSIIQGGDSAFTTFLLRASNSAGAAPAPEGQHETRALSTVLALLKALQAQPTATAADQ